jgi:hypothetical protein
MDATLSTPKTSNADIPPHYFVYEAHVVDARASSTDDSLDPVKPKQKYESMQSFFERKPDFILPPSFFDGPPLFVLNAYRKQVPAKDAFEIRRHDRSCGLHISTHLSYLRLIAPAHCGYKKCKGKEMGDPRSPADWEKTTAALVKELKAAHGLAAIAYPVDE